MDVAVHDGRAFGTTSKIVVTDAACLDAVVAAVDAVVSAVDACCSRFREDSELMHVNRRAGAETVVSPLFLDMLRCALRAARLSGGTVDPTVFHALRHAGYDDDFNRLQRDRPALAAGSSPAPGWSGVVVDEATGTVSLPAGTGLDFGATGKAFAADLAAARALDAGSCGVLVSFGGDISIAGPAPEDGWLVGVADDSGAEVGPDGEMVLLRSGGIATSTTSVRRWRRGGVVMHHIIDPATGLPAAGPWRTVTVAAATCVDANTATTAAIVMGGDAPGWLESLRLPARLVGHDGRIVITSVWPSETSGRSPAPA